MTDTAQSGAASTAPPTASADTDSIVAELLGGSNKGKGDGGADEPEAHTDGEEGHAEESATDADAAGDDGEADAEGDDAAADPEGDDEPAAELSADAETLTEARAALESGDLDKAFELAFGKKPEELFPGNKTWTQWRAANKRRDEQFAAKETKLQSDTTAAQQWFANERSKIDATIRELQPYEAHRQAAMAFQRDGDPQHLVKLVELTSGMSYDDAQKLVLTRTKRSPAERALQTKLAELEAKLQEREQTQTVEQQRAEAQRIYAQDLTIIETQVADAVRDKVVSAEAAKVPKYRERIFNVLLKSKSPSTGRPTLTVAQAAKQVLQGERRRLAAHPLLAKPGKTPPKNPVSAAASTLAKARKQGKPGAPLRRDSQPTGVKDPKSGETTDDIINDLIRGKKRA